MGNNKPNVFATSIGDAEARQTKEKIQERRGRCPKCRRWLHSYLYHIKDVGFVIAWECEGFSEEPDTCDYRRIL